nr:uncharacterized protein LOC105468892 [Macaca nemestrina]
MISSSSPPLSVRRTAELRAACAAISPLLRKGGRGEGERAEEGGVVVCIYREEFFAQLFGATKWHTKRKKKALCLPGARSEPCAPRQPLLEGFLRSRSGLGCSWSASVGDGGSGDSRQNGCGARGGGARSLAPAPGARAALEQTQLEAQRRTGLYSRSARRGLAEPPRHRLRDLDKLLNLGTFFPYLEMEKSKSDGVLLCCPRCS